MHFELFADDLGSTPYRVRFTVTVDPTIFWPLYGELHRETVRESEAWGQAPRNPTEREPSPLYRHDTGGHLDFHAWGDAVAGPWVRDSRCLRRRCW